MGIWFYLSFINIKFVVVVRTLYAKGSKTPSKSLVYIIMLYIYYMYIHVIYTYYIYIYIYIYQCLSFKLDPSGGQDLRRRTEIIPGKHSTF